MSSPSSLFNVQVTPHASQQVRLTDPGTDEVIAIATARGQSWVVEVFVAPYATFVTDPSCYVSQAKVTELLQALVLGLRALGHKRDNR